jgi:hypothetical protein
VFNEIMNAVIKGLSNLTVSYSMVLADGVLLSAAAC